MAGKNRLIAGESYSPNLGDGVIAESLAFLFQQEDPIVENSFLDISLRQNWGAGGGEQNGRLKTTLQSLRHHLGDRTYNRLVWPTLKRSRSQQAWEPILQNSSALIIGGGLLLMDNDLDFPLKLNTLVKMAVAHQLPVHFVACGVGHNRPWSKQGLRLIHEALAEAQTVTLRDQLSQDKLSELIPDIKTAVTFDPAIWARAVYGPPANPSAAPRIGLGVIQVDKINAYNQKNAPLSADDMRNFWLKIIALLQQQDKNVELFSNGSVKDSGFAKEIAEAASAQLRLTVPVAPPPQRPDQLVHTINRYTGAIVFRLHASIIASAYRIPTVGLIWDQKVHAFYAETQRQDFCFDIFSSQPETIVKSLNTALASGIAETALTFWKTKARKTVTIPLQKEDTVNA